MHLPLRYAASLPLLLAIGFALISPLLKQVGLLPSGRGEVPMYAFFIMGIPVSLILVIPNVAAAWVANRYGQAGIAFIGCFLLIGLAVWIAQARFFDRVLQTMGGTDLLSRGGLTMIGVDMLACLAGAWWFGRAIDA